MKVFWICVQKQERLPQLIHSDFIEGANEALETARSYIGAKPEEIFIGCWDTEDYSAAVECLAEVETVKFLMDFG